MSRSSFLLVLAGLLVAASMPPWGWWPLGFLGIALYGSVAEGRREQSFSTGFLFAVAWFLPSMAWMWFLTAPGYIVAILIFCVMHGFASYIAATLSTTDHSHRTALIVCHSLAEVLRLSFPFGGVPLATLAIGQVSGPLAGLASLMGVIGITTATLYIALTHHRFRAMCVVGFFVLLGNSWDSTQSTGRTLNLSIVQGGGEQGTHAVDTNPRDVFDVHMAATKTLQPNQERDAVIWPENAISVTNQGLFLDSPEYTEIAQQAQRLNVPFIVGITEDVGENQFTNAQVVVNTDGSVTGRYDKVRRVPFGEYMPMRSLLKAIGAPTDLVPRDARAGTSRGWLDVADTRASVAISWEIFFDGRVNEGVSDGATFVINPTNGSSYTWTILQSQQIAASRLRALEQGRDVVQISPTGFSAFIDSSGVVHERTSISEQRVVERSIQLRSGRTVYSRMGNAVYIWALLIAFALLVRRRARAIRIGAS
ncbi:MAG: apolipoprotein N-acyltransferase [Actinomycetota bacterium]|jgi:apolipoprotein N-acyltransferase